MYTMQPSDLDIAAVFPQCFDNQFISFPEFSLITTTQGSSFKDPRIAQARQKRTMIEINRSLVYGRQVCINRASLLNCKPFYELYLPEFVDKDGSTHANSRYQIDEIGQLFRARALVPYLKRGPALDGDFAFSVDPDGQRALEHLLKKYDIGFVTLGVDEKSISENAVNRPGFAGGRFV